MYIYIFDKDLKFCMTTNIHLSGCWICLLLIELIFYSERLSNKHFFWDDIMSIYIAQG